MSDWVRREEAERRDDLLGSLGLSICETCSAVVAYPDSHEEWHDEHDKQTG